MINSIVKYPGGKQRELGYILPNIPTKIKNYYEPFVGGGAVFFALKDKVNHAFVNDKSEDLMLLYQAVQTGDSDFIAEVELMDSLWHKSEKCVEAVSNQFSELLKNILSSNELDKDQLKESLDKIISSDKLADLLNKITDKPLFLKFLHQALVRKYTYLHKQYLQGKEITQQGLLDILNTAFKSAIYTYFRRQYNEQKLGEVSAGKRSALYLFLRQYAYSSMFRFSKTGNFNVPYGGKSYNDIYLGDKLKDYQDTELIEFLQAATFTNDDFEVFLKKYPPQKDDFIFLDPPYDSDFSTYDNNKFEAGEQKRLADFMINQVAGNWMLVIKDTDLIRKIYPENKPCRNGQQIYTNEFDKVYSVNFKNRNKRATNHLIITNYALNE